MHGFVRFDNTTGKKTYSGKTKSINDAQLEGKVWQGIAEEC